MTFYERYAAAVEKSGLKPGSKKAADLIGADKSAISKWNKNNTTPQGTTVAAIADAFGVSADYLLGRTDDPTDHAKKKEPKQTKSSIPGVRESFLLLYSRLDNTDKIKIEGVIQGMLMQDKYNAPVLNAAHVRTDVEATEDMIEHDESIMDDEEF